MLETVHEPMFGLVFLILFFALIADWIFGEPEFIWSKLMHPIVLMGNVIGWVDEEYNLKNYSDAQRMRNGAICICCLIIGSVIVGQFISQILLGTGIFGVVLEVFIVFALLAQKSLHTHVFAVVNGLRNEGVQGGRKAVGMIVGRDPELLDGKGIVRASIETLAENFSDGVVAPAFWYGVFGLPGIFAYKMINTADSMIAYKSDRHLHFGKATAHIDDLANWLPARLSAVLIALGTIYVHGTDVAKATLLVAYRDAGLTASPNAGWPEAAMAGALDIALGGPRTYVHGKVEQDYLNNSGEKELQVSDIDEALLVFKYACFALMGVVFLLAIFM